MIETGLTFEQIDDINMYDWMLLLGYQDPDNMPATPRRRARRKLSDEEMERMFSG